MSQEISFKAINSGHIKLIKTKAAKHYTSTALSRSSGKPRLIRYSEDLYKKIFQGSPRSGKIDCDNNDGGLMMPMESMMQSKGSSSIAVAIVGSGKIDSSLVAISSL